MIGKYIFQVGGGSTKGLAPFITSVKLRSMQTILPDIICTKSWVPIYQSRGLLYLTYLAYLRIWLFFIQILKCLVFNVFGVFTYLRIFASKILKCPVFSVFGVFTYLRFLQNFKVPRYSYSFGPLLVITLPGHHLGDIQAGSSSAMDSGAMLAMNITWQHLVHPSQFYSYSFSRNLKSWNQINQIRKYAKYAKYGALWNLDGKISNT